MDKDSLILYVSIEVGKCYPITMLLDVDDELPDLLKYLNLDFDTVLSQAIPEFVKQHRAYDKYCQMRLAKQEMTDDDFDIPDELFKPFLALTWCAINNPINGVEVVETADHYLGYTHTIPKLVWKSAATYRRGTDDYAVEVHRIENPFNPFKRENTPK